MAVQRTARRPDAHGRGFSFPNMLYQVHGISHLLKYRPLPLVLCFLFCLFGMQQSIAKDFAVQLLTNDNSCGTLMIVKLLFYYNFTFDFWFAE